MKCVYFYVLALTLAFPRDVRHVRSVVESVTSWGARCTRRVRVVPDVPSTLNKRKRARELLSQHIFGHIRKGLCMRKALWNGGHYRKEEEVMHEEGIMEGRTDA